jgi:hypothetical protein
MKSMENMKRGDLDRDKGLSPHPKMPATLPFLLMVGAVVEDLRFPSLPLDVVAGDMGDAGDPESRRVPS